MSAKTTVKLTMQTAQTLVRREFGFPVSALRRRDNTPADAQIYEMQCGRLWVRVSNDWQRRDGLYYLEVCHVRSGTISAFFNPETLCEDFTAGDRYRRMARDEG